MKIFRLIILALLLTIAPSKSEAQFGWFAKKLTKKTIVKEAAEKAGREALERTLVKSASKSIIYKGSYKAAINRSDNVISKQYLKRKAAVESAEALARIAQKKTTAAALKSVSKGSTKSAAKVVARKGIANTDFAIKESIERSGTKSLVAKTLVRKSSTNLLEKRLGKEGAEQWTKLLQTETKSISQRKSAKLLRDLESSAEFRRQIVKDPTLLKAYNNTIGSSLRTDVGTLRYIRNGADSYSVIPSFKKKWGVGDDLRYKDIGGSTKIFNKNNELLGTVKPNGKHGYEVVCAEGNHTLLNLRLMRSSTYYCNGCKFITDKHGRTILVEYTVPPNIKTAPRDKATIARIRDMKNDYNVEGLQTGRKGIINDEGGHLMPLEAGGTNDIANIAPQSMKTNRGLGSDWRKGELAAKRAANNGDEVKVIINVEYDKNSLSMRPIAFKRTQIVNGEYQKVNSKVYKELHIDNTPKMER